MFFVHSYVRVVTTARFIDELLTISIDARAVGKKISRKRFSATPMKQWKKGSNNWEGFGFYTYVLFAFLLRNLESEGRGIRLVVRICFLVGIAGIAPTRLDKYTMCCGCMLGFFDTA